MRSYQFFPGKNEALKLLKNFKFNNYPNSRNFIEGDVSLLSPYITHGILSLRDIYCFLCEKYTINTNNKFLKELAWREFFYHVWDFKNDKIFSSIKPTLIDEKQYISNIPYEIKHAETGISAIDKIISSLYKTGYIHNHARLWLASFMVHIHKISWKSGASWMYSHLLDGDLASNFLSWQWVAGTFSSKPYLFNSANIEKYAPRDWSCRGTILDNSYEKLFEIANTPKLNAKKKKLENCENFICNNFNKSPLSELKLANSNDFSSTWIIHPWNIDSSLSQSSKKKKIGVFFEDFHSKWVWSNKRWRFVIDNMKMVCDDILFCPSSVDIVGAETEYNPHLHWILKKKTRIKALHADRLWKSPEKFCGSFSKFWKIVEKQKIEL